MTLEEQELLVPILCRYIRTFFKTPVVCLIQKAFYGPHQHTQWHVAVRTSTEDRLVWSEEGSTTFDAAMSLIRLLERRYPKSPDDEPTRETLQALTRETPQ